MSKDTQDRNLSVVKKEYVLPARDERDLRHVRKKTFSTGRSSFREVAFVARTESVIPSERPDHSERASTDKNKHSWCHGSFIISPETKPPPRLAAAATSRGERCRKTITRLPQNPNGARKKLISHLQNSSLSRIPQLHGFKTKRARFQQRATSI